jgi:hypothetical protein
MQVLYKISCLIYRIYSISFYIVQREKKFRSIFINEVHQFLLNLRLIKRKQQRFTQSTCAIKPELTSKTGFPSKQPRLSKTRKTVEVLFNGKTACAFLNEEKKNSSRHTIDELSTIIL